MLQQPQVCHQHCGRLLFRLILWHRGATASPAIRLWVRLADCARANDPWCLKKGTRLIYRLSFALAGQGTQGSFNLGGFTGAIAPLMKQCPIDLDKQPPTPSKPGPLAVGAVLNIGALRIPTVRGREFEQTATEFDDILTFAGGDLNEMEKFFDGAMPTSGRKRATSANICWTIPAPSGPIPEVRACIHNPRGGVVQMTITPRQN